VIDLFAKKPTHDPVVVRRLKEWTIELLGLDDSVPVMVTELRCTEDDCPDVETVIAILDKPGNPRTIKVFKPLAEVTRENILAALNR